MTQSDPNDSVLSRRNALKTAAAVTTGAVVWSEPTLKGLVRRPAYASASTSIQVFLIPAMQGAGRVRFFGDNGLPLTIFSDGGFLLELAGPGPGGSNPEPGGGEYTLTATLEGCDCAIDLSAANSSIERDVTDDGGVEPPVFGVVAGNVVTYDWTADQRANTFETPAFSVTCTPI